MKPLFCVLSLLVSLPVAAHAAGATITLIDTDDMKAALENLGDLRFLAEAQPEDLSRAGTDKVAAEQKLRDWFGKPENQNASIATYNALAPEKGGPPAGFEWYPFKI